MALILFVYLWSFNAVHMDETIELDSVVYDYDLDLEYSNSTITIGVEESNPHLNPSPLYWLFAVSRAMTFMTMGYILGKMKR